MAVRAWVGITILGNRDEEKKRDYLINKSKIKLLFKTVSDPMICT